MKSVRLVKTSVLLLALSLFAGCGSKSDKPAASSPDAKGTAVSGAVPVVPEQDKTDAKSEGTKVIAQLKSGEFLAIYKEASPAFRNLGTEPQFVAMMQQTRKKTGALQSSKQLALETGADKRQMVTYSVDYDNVRSNLRLSFLRSKEGKMELVGLSQKDDLVKNPEVLKNAGNAAKNETAPKNAKK